MTGYSLMTIFFLLLLKETIFIVADINQSRRRVREAVEDLDRAEAGDHEAARLLLREIDNLEPVSGYGHNHSVKIMGCKPCTDFL